MLAPVTHILSYTSVRRERFLPIPGRVLVRKGQSVLTNDIIAEGILQPRHIILDIVRGLGLPKEKVEGQIHCQVSSNVIAGDVLAGPVGMTRRVVRTPVNGQVVLIRDGRIYIQVNGQDFQLKAGLPGEVEELIPDRGAIIRTTGSLIQGVWGNGQIQTGPMQLRISSPEQELDAEMLDETVKECVIVGGFCRDDKVVNAALKLPVKGMILASIPVDLITMASKVSFPIIVIEGFGKHAMNSAAFELLAKYEKHEASMNAEAWDRYQGIRPEVVIPLTATANPPETCESIRYSPGQTVRITQPPEIGRIGSLVDLVGLTSFPNGQRTQAAKIRLDAETEIMVPLSNMEVLI